MIKVLIIHQSSNSKANGIASHCNTLYHLFKDNQDVVVLKPENYPARDIKIFNGVFHFRKLLKAIKESKADVVHVHGYTTLQVGQALLAAVLCRKSIVYSPHWHPFCELRRPLMAKVFFYLTIAPLVKRFAACCVCINKEDTAFIKKLKKPVYTIAHCLADFPERMNEKQPSQGKKSILFVGRFDAANKGIDYLWHLPEGLYDIHLVGKGEIAPRSDMHIHQNIPQAELMRLYHDCSLVVVPSQYEAFSLVSLEALSMGTPVVMSNKVRIADYLEGVDGVAIFRYGDYDGFVKAVLDSDSLHVDVNQIQSIFSKEAIRSQYAKLYTEAAQQKRNTP